MNNLCAFFGNKTRAKSARNVLHNGEIDLYDKHSGFTQASTWETLTILDVAEITRWLIRNGMRIDISPIQNRHPKWLASFGDMHFFYDPVGHMELTNHGFAF